MLETKWKIYFKEEISKEYRGGDRLLVLSLEKEKACNVSKNNYDQVGVCVVLGDSGAIFNGVNYDKLIENDSFVEGYRPRTEFNQCIRELEKLLLIHGVAKND